PLKPGTCGLSYMRATMRSLAAIHATTAVFMDFQGRLVKEAMSTYLLPYIIYLSVIHPDLQHQLSLLLKFHKHLNTVLNKVKKEVRTHLGKTLIHGDSKIDNFMYRKIAYSLEEEYAAVLIDWQGIGLDYVTGDLIWTIYGFMKNLPDKNATVDTYVDYSLEYYHKELLSLFKTLGDEYYAVQAIQKGFIYEFLKTVILRPLFNLKDPEALLGWSIRKIEGKDEEPPAVEDVFRSGKNRVFHDLGELCIAAMRESIFNGGSNSFNEEDSEDSVAGETPLPSQETKKEEGNSIRGDVPQETIK
ncbi:Uncharacterized protein FKW44_021880, partial [Caligus rogercresseyi]